jgi:hypothetical protein
MGRHKFRVSPTPDNSHDAIPFVPAVSIRSQLCDFAGKFEPRDVLRCSRWCRILTQPLQEVCAIKPSAPHVNEHFVRPRLWLWHVMDFQDLRTTETSNNNSFHGLVACSHLMLTAACLET